MQWLVVSSLPPQGGSEGPCNLHLLVQHRSQRARHQPTDPPPTFMFTTVVLCLPEYRSGRAAHDQHGSKVPSTMNCRLPSRSSAAGMYSRRACTSSGVIADMARLIVGCETP